MQRAKLYVLVEDPETRKAETVLKKRGIQYQLVDVEREGILAFLDRDLGIKQLPFLIAGNRKYEGLTGIKAFAEG